MKFVYIASFEMMSFLYSSLTSDPNSLQVQSSAGGEEAMALLSLNLDASIHTKGNRTVHTPLTPVLGLQRQVDPYESAIFKFSGRSTHKTKIEHA